MKLFECQHCGQMLYFENVRCEKCGHRLGYLAEANVLSALERPARSGDASGDEAQSGEAWSGEAQGESAPGENAPGESAECGETWCGPGARGRSYRFCVNSAHDACNWLIRAESPDLYCAACRHNRTVPDLTQAGNIVAWRNLERAKHRLIYTLLRLRLPLNNRGDDPEHGLVFDFLAEPPEQAAGKVMTGHDNGVITIAVVEADDAEREKRRLAMGEPYRTLLGHFRHEVGHYFWDRLVSDGGRLAACREIFGDESKDYGQALHEYYNAGPPPDWQNSYVSAYAAAHPWEDFAETWAHYLHIVDTLEMADAFGLRIKPRVDNGADLAVAIDFDPYAAPDIHQITDAWLPLTFAVNSLNRCMGVADLYPFVLTPAVICKLGFIHGLLHDIRPEPLRDHRCSASSDGSSANNRT
jgi:hypothetical protein